jgi:F0F1-type ATP synthase epsilon subunit
MATMSGTNIITEEAFQADESSEKRNKKKKKKGKERNVAFR